MAVKISGTVLASLFYDQSRSNGDQIGFLIGNVVKHITDTISDSQINNQEVETNIYIYETAPSPRDQRFFTTRGQIKTQAIADILKDRDKKIVGLYSCRRNSTLRMSYRERLLYQNLAECIAEDKNMFLCLLCSSKPSPNKSTHTLDYGFLRLVDNVFKRMPVDIVNLGDTTHSEYRHLPSLTACKSQGSNSLIVQQYEYSAAEAKYDAIMREAFLNSHGQMEVKHIQSLNGSFSRKLEEISKAVVSSEKHLADIEEEVLKCRKQVRLKQLEKQQQLVKQNKTKMPNKTGPVLQEVGKRPSVDDILFMDQADSQTDNLLQPPPSYETVCNTRVKPSREPQQGEPKTSGKAQVKLTTPVTLHTRSNSFGQDRNPNTSISPTHTRSRSSDSTNDKSPQSSDPFSFVSSEMAKSRTTKLGNSAQNSGSNSGSRDTRFGKSSQGKSGGIAAAKSLNNGKTKSDRSRKHDNETSGAKETKSNNHESMEVDNSGTGRLRSKSGTLQAGPTAKKCSQEAAQDGGTSGDSLDESSMSQDTYEMDVSSSPVY